MTNFTGTLYVMLWSNGMMVSVVYGDSPSYGQTFDMKDAIIHTDLTEAMTAANEQGWDVGILQCTLIGKEKT